MGRSHYGNEARAERRGRSHEIGQFLIGELGNDRENTKHNTVRTGKAAHLQRSVNRGKDLCTGHTVWCGGPKDIQVEIPYVDFT